MSKILDRISSSAVSISEQEALSQVLSGKERPHLVSENSDIEIPDAIFRLLTNAVEAMKRGESVIVIPENKELTTQQAAEILGFSRPHLIKLIEAAKIPCHRIGSHRRIRLSDLESYQTQRDLERRALLDNLFNGIAEDGAYE